MCINELTNEWIGTKTVTKDDLDLKSTIHAVF